MDEMPPSGLNEDGEEALSKPSWFADTLVYGIASALWDAACWAFGTLLGFIFG